MKKTRGQGFSRLCLLVICMMNLGILVIPAFAYASDVPIITAFNGPSFINFEAQSEQFYPFSVVVEGGKPPYTYSWSAGPEPFLVTKDAVAQISTFKMHNVGPEQLWVWVEVTDSDGVKAGWFRPDGRTTTQFGFCATYNYDAKTMSMTYETDIPYKSIPYAKENHGGSDQGNGESSSGFNMPDIPSSVYWVGGIAVAVGIGGLAIKGLSGNGSGSTEEPDDSGVTDNHDGSLSKTLPDGGRATKYTDGTIYVEYPDNTKVTQYPDGTEVWHDPDGTKVTKESNGDNTVEYPNGTSTKLHANGDMTTTERDGSSRTIDKDNNPKRARTAKGDVGVYNPDGSITVTSPDGSTMTVDKTGKNYSGTVKTSEGVWTVSTDKEGALNGTMRDGSQVKMDSDGNLTSYKLPLGDPQGRVIEGDAESGSIRLTATKGENAGDTAVIKTDGSASFNGSDGSALWKNANGTGGFKTADGTTMETHQNGTATLSKPGSGSVSSNPDGSLTVQSPDGGTQNIAAETLGGDL